MKKISRREFLESHWFGGRCGPHWISLRRLCKLHRSLHGIFCRRQRSRFHCSTGC